MHRTLNSLLLFGFLLVTSVLSAQQRTQSLNSDDGGARWEVCPQADVNATGAEVSTVGFHMEDPVPGVVPGVVFTAYVEAGREANPDVASNIYKVDETWYNRPFWYRTEFTLSQAEAASERVWLYVNNTNRYADFWLNGKKISGTDESTKDVSGHMLRSRFDVTDVIHREGTNALAVLIYDADQKKTRRDPGPYGVACSPSYLAAAGWDWIPYVPGRLAGITGNVSLVFTGKAALRDPWVRSYLPCNERAELTVSADVVNTGSEDRDYLVRGTIQPADGKAAPVAFSKTIRVRGWNKATIHITKEDVPALSMDHPQLWWPNGYGDPNLYTCSLQVCEVETPQQVSDATTFRFGIRSFDYRIEKNKVDYPVLNIYCNGQRIFCRGGNWGMSEYLLRCHGEEYEPKVRLHKEMNYNMIRLWTGCVTDEEFYDYCDQYGIMVWDDFWLYVAYNDVAEHDAFKVNARDKVRRLRNHACIAVWCGANETHPVPDIDQALRMIVMEEDGNDRLYKSCSNQDALSGSGWWKDLPPHHHFSTSGSNLAFDKPSYPYGIDYGYGFRSEIGMATFPSYESTCLFIPKEERWPLPTDEVLKDSDNTVWNHHFFGKEASNAGPADYVKSVNERYGQSKGLEEFCEKAQLINLEDMKGMYEAWNDKMWSDAAGLLIWMSHPAYPSFVWQTYDYYYDPTGCYWGAKSACEPQHIQWNCENNSVKVINVTGMPLQNAIAEAHVYTMAGEELTSLAQKSVVNVAASNRTEAFVLPLSDEDRSSMQFIRLSLKAHDGTLLSENFYWRNATGKMDYTALNDLPACKVTCTMDEVNDGKCELTLHNASSTIAFANRVRLVNSKTGDRILPAIFSDNYVSLLPGESRTLTVEVNPSQLDGGFKVLLKQFGKKEKVVAAVKR